MLASLHVRIHRCRRPTVKCTDDASPIQCRNVLLDVKRVLASAQRDASGAAGGVAGSSTWLPCRSAEELARAHHFRVAFGAGRGKFGDGVWCYDVVGEAQSQRLVPAHEVYAALLGHVLSAALGYLREREAGGPAGGGPLVIRAVAITLPDGVGAEIRQGVFSAAEGGLRQGGLGNLGLDGSPPRVVIMPASVGPAVHLALNASSGCADNVHDPFLLVDWGGGGLTAAVYATRSGQLQCLAALTDMSLGAQEVECALMERVAAKTGLDFSASAVARFKMRKAIVSAIRDLTVADSAEIEADNVVHGEDVSCRVSLSEFNDLLAPLIARVLEHVRAALAAVPMTTHDVWRVVMLGGATRMPRFEAELEAMFPANTPGSRTLVAKTLHRESCVVTGAALASLASLKGEWLVNGAAACAELEVPVLAGQRTPQPLPPKGGSTSMDQGREGEGWQERRGSPGAGKPAIVALELEQVRRLLAQRRESALSSPSPALRPQHGAGVAGAAGERGGRGGGAGAKKSEPRAEKRSEKRKGKGGGRERASAGEGAVRVHR